MKSLKTPPNWPLPANEIARLEELTSLGMLDTPEEQPFDGLVEVAAALLEVPYAGISLMGAERQWFKASVGIPFSSTSRAHAFCAHTILTPHTMVVEDLTKDDRFKSHPFVAAGPEVRAYAGTPLVTDRGRCLGTLCVLDIQPRKFSAERLRLMERLAQSATDAFQTRRLIRDLTAVRRPA